MENNNVPQNAPNPSGNANPQGAPSFHNEQQVIVNVGPTEKLRNKWVALLLCLFFGVIGAHKFYEGKTGMGVLYLFTGGLFIIGVIVDFIALLFKPVHYSV